MKSVHLPRWKGVLLLLLAVATSARAQLTLDGVTNVIDGSVSNVSGSLIIGSNLANTLLVITNGGILSNSFGEIGYNASSSNNTVVVTGGGSLWDNGDYVLVGSSGSGNRLMVSNGALVANTNGFLGFYSTAGNNVVTVTGAGSVWTNSSELFVGFSGEGNQLVVSNGAAVFSRRGYVGDGSYLGGGNFNLAVVTGTNSLWSNSGDLRIGGVGSGNRLWVEDGGVVVSSNGFIGSFANGNSNVAVVAGAGSLWASTGSLRVGSAGAGNQLVVSNGGTVSATNVTLGFFDPSTNNRITIESGTLRVTNAGGTGALDIRGGTNQFDGGLIDVDQLVMTNVLGSFEFNGGTLITRGGVISNEAPFIVGANGTTPAIWDVQNGVAGNTMVVASNLFIGLNVPNSQLLITNGQTLQVQGLQPSFPFASSVLGSNALSTNNLALVSGAGSYWSNAGGLIIGSNGAFNRLIVSNGGFVQNTNTFLGFASGSMSNLAIVTGAGSVWSDAGSLYVGRRGVGNMLQIGDGGLVQSSNGHLGYDSVSSSNLAIVSGAGSVWSNSYSLFVGRLGAANTLVISNGGAVVADVAAYLGYNFAIIGGPTFTSSSSNNLITISDGTLRVANAAGNGVFGIRNGTNQFNSGLIDVDQLVMTNALGVFEFNGGTLVTRGGTISNAAPFVMGVDGSTPAIWDVRSGTDVMTVGTPLTVGLNVPNNLLLVTNGQTLWARGRYTGSGASSVLGANETSTNNLAIVSGAGSSWSNTSSLIIGSNSAFNRLIVTNGGLVRSTNGYVGHDLASSNNLVIVSGAGSVWSNSATLYVGYDGAGNSLRIEDGGLVRSTNAYLGYGSISHSNIAIVSGVDSVWRTGGLYVGSNGTGNKLVIENGGFVRSTAIQLGHDSASSSNMVVVTGSGSALSNNGDLFVGQAGDGNSLIVSNGALVYSFDSYLGGNFGSRSNFALVTGPGTVWSTRDNMFVGSNGAFNTLVITNGGLVSSRSGIIGTNSSASNNLAIVTGSGSVWSNVVELSVGRRGDGNRLEVSNGGAVFSALAYVGWASSASNNLAMITGEGSLWVNSGNLWVGYSGKESQLIVNDQGTVRVANLIMGGSILSSSNRVLVERGNLIVTNATGTGVFNIFRGTNRFDDGLIDVDQLVMTSTLGFFEFNSGTLVTKGTTVSNDQPFAVGNGSSAATYHMSGAATNVHSFNNGLLISSNAMLTGSGTIVGNVTNFGTISAGTSPGAITINGSLSLTASAGMTFEIGGLIPTNQYDVVTVTNYVELAGTLSLSLLDNFLPDDGDTFTLLTFGSASGSFANIMGGRVSLTNNLASFVVTQTATNLQLSDVTYVDTDGDGQGDLQELAAGTDPLLSASVMAVTSLAPNPSGHVVVEFQSVPGKTYRIEYSTNFAQWSIATTNIPSAGAVTTWVDDGSLTGGLSVDQRFYRVGLE